MSAQDFELRRHKLIRSLKSADIDSLLVSSETNVRYLTGFTGDSSWLFISSGNTILISDSRYSTQIGKECPGLDTEIRGVGKSMPDAAAAIVKKAGVTHLGVEGNHLTISQHASLENTVTRAQLIVTDSLTEQLRVIKDKWEIAQIRQAIHQAERGIAVLRASVRPNQTETEIRYALEASMRDFGAAGPAFEPIVGVGPTAALPHAHSGVRMIEESPLLLVDWGAQSKSGYRSDLTRVFFTGTVTKKMQNVYQTVLDAQQAAIQKIKPGVACKDVDAVARGIISDAGYGRKFGHGLGHGIGLDIHEAVRLGPGSNEILKPGMIVTVEPGIYLKGRFGVRIEDDVLVTRGGFQVLTSVPQEFDDAMIDFLA
ncbi:MAG: Xaa-Pro peptidase family protein [Fuerstiella sp.]|nr:Xaa-Pro peptidase family protein [Fuerstiella sp.]